MRRLAAAFALGLLATTAAAQEQIVLGLSRDRIAITATFDGSDILIFGAVKRLGPAPAGPPLEVVITVSGPLTPVTVREKDRVFGLWMNRASIVVDAAPSFYAVATTGPLDEVLSSTEDLRHNVSIDRAIRSVGHPVTNAGDFTDALIRIRAAEGLYQLLEGQVSLDEETLFRTSISLPANLIEGDYATRIFLTRDGRIVDSYETTIAVRKVGLERWLFNLSRQSPLAYGLMSLVLAVAAGWAASAGFRALRR